MKKQLFIFLLFSLLYAPFANAHEYLAEGFAVQEVSDEFYQVVNVEFDHLGRMFVGMREGYLKIYQEGQAIIDVIDIEAEVDNMGDLGMLNMALDPNFEENGYVYMLYFADFHHVTTYGTAQYNPDFGYWGPSIHRLSRFTLDKNTNFTTLVEGSQKILIGTDVADGIPQVSVVHGCGAIAFGADGSILVSAGDASTYEGPYTGDGPPYYNELVLEALSAGIIREKEDLGVFRAQLVDNLNGKVLRIDPETGDGLPSNPYYDADNPRAPKSRVWAMGLRNPFRFTMKPGTGSPNPADAKPGTMFIGDVGEADWEEINILEKGGTNFGWPIYEGINENTQFSPILVENEDALNPLFGENTCEQEFFYFQNLIQPTATIEAAFSNPCDENMPIDDTIATFQHTLPAIVWPHAPGSGYTTYLPAFDNEGLPYPLNLEQQTAVANDGNFVGYASVAGDFYEGETWPEEYHQGYFHADYVGGWIRFFAFNDLNELEATYQFYDDDKSIIDVQYNPHDDCLYFVSFEWSKASINKICYGVNPPPNAIVESTTHYGSSPLTVDFDASQSYDPLGEAITYVWDFGDGTTAQGATAAHTFTTTSDDPVAFAVVLTVTDEEGNSATTEKVVNLNNTPPQIEITSIADDFMYSMAGKNVLNLAATVIDAEHYNDELLYAWQTILHHDTHLHPEPQIEQPTAQTILDPVGCDGAVYFYEIVHTVTDPIGLSSTESVYIYPDCATEPFIELGLFTGSVQRENISLNWITLFEKQVANFEIERQEPGQEWVSIVVLESNNPSINQTYSITDIPPSDVYVGYRLKMISNDGTVVYSNPIQLRMEARTDLYLYPNPNNGLLNVDMANLSANASLNIYNIKGELVYFKSYEGVGNNEWYIDQIDISALLSGVYVVQLVNESNTFVDKLIVL